MSDAELDKLFKRIPDDAFTQLTSTLKQSDKAKLFAKLNNVDPTFAKKLAPNVDNLGDTAAILKNPPPSGDLGCGLFSSKQTILPLSRHWDITSESCSNCLSEQKPNFSNSAKSQLLFCVING